LTGLDGEKRIGDFAAGTVALHDCDNSQYVSDFKVGPHHFSVLISLIARIITATVEHDSQLDRPQLASLEWGM
jgi:hypothetical protein